MTSNSQNSPSRDSKVSDDAPAADQAGVQQEADAAEQQRKTQEELAKPAGDETEVSLHGRVKQHSPDDLEPVQNSSDEPVIEDEP